MKIIIFNLHKLKLEYINFARLFRRWSPLVDFADQLVQRRFIFCCIKYILDPLNWLVAAASCPIAQNE